MTPPYEARNRLIISEDRYNGTYIQSAGLISSHEKEKHTYWCFEEDFLNNYATRFKHQEGPAKGLDNWGPDDSDLEAREFWYFVEAFQEKIRFGLGGSPLEALRRYLIDLGRPHIEDLEWGEGEATMKDFLEMKYDIYL
jgi:hypothetical protein